MATTKKQAKGKKAAKASAEPAMRDFRVRWTVDVPARSPEEAARKAYEMQQDPESTATLFDVHEWKKGKPGDLTVVVDVLDLMDEDGNWLEE